MLNGVINGKFTKSLLIVNMLLVRESLRPREIVLLGVMGNVCTVHGHRAVTKCAEWTEWTAELVCYRLEQIAT